MIDHHQWVDYDETGLNWKMLQEATLVDHSEKGARGFKVSKEIPATANASGDFRLSLVVIHKYIKLSVSRHCNVDENLEI